MKTKRSDASTVSRMLSVVAIVGFSASVFVCAASAPPESRYPKDNFMIRADAFNVKHSKEEVKVLKAKIRRDSKAGNKAAVIMGKRELKKSKADLRRDKSYLRADKQDLRRDHRLAIQDKRHALKEERADVRKARRQMYLNLVRGRDEAVARDADKLVLEKRQVKAGERALANRKEERRSEMLAVERDIREIQGQTAFAKGVEDVLGVKTVFASAKMTGK